MGSKKENFVDEVSVKVLSGAGGDGKVSFRRAKFEPMGGPDGGDGGRGGDVVLVVDRNLRTLLEIRHRSEIKAGRGQDGGVRDKTGAGGAAREIRVPIGTMVFEVDTQNEDEDDAELLADLTTSEERFVVCKGGRGGHGNTRFKTSTRQAPQFAKPGLEGEFRNLRLSLKLLADVALVGYPNAGKSTLLRRISHAKPRVGAYPFTTLVPSLGVVERGDERIIVADIPGLIDGASEGAGLGDRFLRHIERTRVIVHLLDCSAMIFEERDLMADYRALRRELANYQPELCERPEIVVLNKIELVNDEAQLESVEAQLREAGIEPHRISGATGSGCNELIGKMFERIQELKLAEAEATQASAQELAALEQADGTTAS